MKLSKRNIIDGPFQVKRLNNCLGLWLLYCLFVSPISRCCIAWSGKKKIGRFVPFPVTSIVLERGVSTFEKRKTTDMPLQLADNFSVRRTAIAKGRPSVNLCKQSSSHKVLFTTQCPVWKSQYNIRFKRRFENREAMVNIKKYFKCERNLPFPTGEPLKKKKAKAFIVISAD